MVMPHRRRPPLDPEIEALIEEVNANIRQCAARLRELSEQREAIFRGLRAQGWKIHHLAQLAGISPQRMSKILLTHPRKARFDGWD